MLFLRFQQPVSLGEDPGFN